MIVSTKRVLVYRFTMLFIATLFMCFTLIANPSVAHAAETYDFLSKLPHNDWYFNQPTGLATDIDGNVYIADSGNNQIQKFNAGGDLITKWGSAGSGDGQFNYPRDIAVDSSGNVYVVDTNNSRVQKFTSEGAFITKWGSPGSGDGQFNYPRDIAVDSAGNVYVIDLYNHRIQEFTSDGAFIAKWGSYGSGDGQFSYPQAIAVDAAGSVYVADAMNYRIQKFTSYGAFITKWGNYGSGDGQFNGTQGIAVDSSSNVYVAGSNRIQKFTSAGVFITKWGNYGSVDGQFITPVGIAVGSAGNVYVADAGNNRIQKFTSYGAFVTKWGRDGSGDGLSIYHPESIAVDSFGNVYVADQLNRRIQKFTSYGAFITKWGSQGSGDGQFSSPQGIAVDSAGNVYVADGGNNRIQKFTSGGAFITKWGYYGHGDGQFFGPHGIAIDSAGNVYVVDAYNYRIQKFTSDGVFITKWGYGGWRDGQFSSPQGIAVDSAGNVYVADGDSNRIQKFTSDGTFITKWGNYDTGNWGSQGSGDGQFSAPHGIAVDSAGNVYVADSGNYRIQKFTSNGGYITKWGSPGAGDGQFSGPKGIAVDSSGNVYVADFGNNRIAKFAGVATPPTTIMYRPQFWPQGEWFKTPPTITLDVLQANAAIYYQWDSTSSAGWQTYTEPIVAIEGQHRLYYCSIDSFGNVEPPQGGNLYKVDTLPPTTSLSTIPPAPDGENGWFKRPPRILLTTEPDIYISYQWDSTSPDMWQDYRESLYESIYAPEGQHTLYYYTRDQAGQEESIKSSAFSVLSSSETYDFIAKWPTQWADFNPNDAAIDANGNVYVSDYAKYEIQKFSPDGALIAKWGSQGSGDGQFNYAHGIAVDSTGNVYVTDAENNRIQKFTSEGAFITEWGSYGADDGQFSYPQDIAVDSAGNIYVFDSNNSRIQKFTSDGAFITKWGSYGSDDGQFGYGVDITVDSAGNVYAVDPNNYRVQTFTSDGAFITKWGSYGSDDGQFSYPRSLVVDSSGNVYVADGNNIQTFTSDGAFLSKWGSPGTGDGQFNSLSKIAVDAEDNIFAVDYLRIQKFTNLGSFISRWGSFGSGDGQFDYPIGAAADSAGNVYVTDFGNSRIQKISKDGSMTVKWGSYGSGDGQFDNPRGIAIDSAGNVYVVDTNNNRVQKFTSGGAFITKWGSSGSGDGQFNYPQGIAVDSSDMVYVADGSGRDVQKFTSDGVFVAKWSDDAGDGRLAAPQSIAVDSLDNVYVSNNVNNRAGRIEKFNADGGLVDVWHKEFGQAAIAVDSFDNVYLTDSGNARVQKFTSYGAYVGKWGIYGRGDGQFNDPQGIAIDSSGNVFVVDSSNRRIQKFKLSDIPGRRLPAPAGFSAVGFSEGEMKLSWLETPTSGATLLIQRRFSPDAAWEDGVDVSADTTSYLDSGLGGATTYYYRVKAVSWNLESDWAETSGTTNAFTVSGRVTDENGSGLADSLVLAYRTEVYGPYWDANQQSVFEAAWADHWTLTDQNGNYTFTDQYLTPGTYKLRVIPSNGYLSEWRQDQLNYGAADPLEVGSSLEVVDFTVSADNVAPTGTVVINNNDATSSFAEITLSSDAADNNAGNPLYMRLSNEDATAWSNWELFNVSKSWILSAGAGTHTVWAQFKDSAGNVSAPVSDTIYFDPVVRNVELGPDAAIQTGERVVTLGGADRAFPISVDVTGAVTYVGVRVWVDWNPVDIDLTNNPPGSDHWEATVDNATSGEITLIIERPETGRQEQVIGRVQLIDPSGYVTDQETGAPIEGATVTLYRRNQATGDFEIFDPSAGTNSLLMEPDINPQLSRADGYYGWDVAPGTYYVSVSKGGFLDVGQSRIVTVPPPVVDLNIQMTAAAGDDVSPVTSYSIAPEAPDGDNGWYKTAPVVTLTSDETAVTCWQLDSTGGAWNVYDGPVGVTEGAHVLYYYSVDSAGNAEAAKVAPVVKVDTIKPIPGELSGEAVGPTEIDLSWTPTTDSGSGIGGYRIFNADTDELLAETSSTAFSLTGLEPGVTYNYYIRTFDLAGNVSDQSNAVAVTTPMPTVIMYAGNVQADYSDLAILGAVLIDDNGAPVIGKEIRFELGSQETTAVTDLLGRAQTAITIDQMAGAKNLIVSFAGNGNYLPSKVDSSFEVTKETVTINYTGDLITQRYQAPHMKAQIAEGDGSPGALSGKPIDFAIGNPITTQTAMAVTDATGTASTTPMIDLPAGIYKLTAAFAGDGYYQSTETSPSTFVVWEPIAGLSAKGSGKILKPDVKKAEFGFHIKYPKTSTSPKGEFEYEEEFKDASGKEKEIELESTAINWLVAADGLAVFDGQAAFEHQSAAHTFRVFAVDNGKPGAGVDTFELYLDGLPFASGILIKGDVIIK